MTSLLKVRVRLAIVVMAGAALTACSTQTPGTADPVATNSPSPSSSQVSNVFGDLKACELLDKAMASSSNQGFSPSTPEKAGGSNSCETEKSGYGEIGLSLHTGLGIKDLKEDPAKVHDGDVNGRPAVQIRDGIGAKGNCEIGMAVGEKNRAYMAAVLNTGSTDEACDFAMSVAKKVEPFLPKGN
ncbi:DUF3558 family protein [Amycolatopsis sp. cg5]|uniref:DUF3558 family protein n=1 Tax=Amycolatopsis sp. cg5 TaxID=3238802 RepID=UPI0035236CF0